MTGPEAAAVRVHTDTFEAPDGEPRYRIVWRPRAPARGAAVLAHGYAEHAGRYETLARALVAEGFSVHALDQAGHGHSPGRRGQILRAGAWTESLAALLESVQAEGGRVLACGHSFGATAVARVAQTRPDLLDACVLSAPYLRTALGHPAWLLRAGAWASWLLPHLRTAQISLQDVASDPAARRAYGEDPFVYRGGVPLAASRELHALAARVRRDAARLRTPTLIVHGTHDGVAAFQGSEAFRDGVAAEDLTLRAVEGGRHDLLHDAGADAVREGIVAWVRDRLG